MASAKISPAQLGDSPSAQTKGVPYSPLYDDVYHSVAGAWGQAGHVFLAGNGLPGRWQGRHRFVVLETGFGLGNNFLATWAAWLDDPQRCERLCFISIEKHPLRRADLEKVHATCPRPELVARLLAAWPPLTPGLHTLDFDAPDGRGSLSLTLGLGDVADLLPALMASVDAFYLDGFAPDKNPAMWDPRWLSRLGRLAAPGATAATWSAAREIRDALTQAGFEAAKVRGFQGKHSMTQARYVPRFTPATPPGGLQAASRQRHALVLGAGLAGCAAAWALTREGWHVTVLDRHDGPAGEASGNPGGLFHSIVHGEDGIHARVYRAAALATRALVAPWMAEGRLAGACDGLLRLDAKTQSEAARALIDKLALPPDHLQWLDQAEAARRADLPLPSGGWLFVQGGWLPPADYAALLLNEARQTGRLTWLPRAQVQSLRRASEDAAAPPSSQWQALDSQGQVLAQAGSLVLACAMGAQDLLAPLGVEIPPLTAIRGQLTTLPPDTAGLKRPALPVADAGYSLSLPDGQLLCGATTQHDDPDPVLRDADHRHNLRQAARLGVLPLLADTEPLPPGTAGRAGWRATTPDRLPLVGCLPAPIAIGKEAPARLDQPRLIPRLRDADGGLYILGGFGSRGITWAALAARLLAHWMEGSPCPVESDLRDALDPARFTVRRLRGQAPGHPR